MDSESQVKHANAFGAAARGVLQAAVEFAADVKDHLSRFDCARIYLAAGVALVYADLGPQATSSMLRELADRIEAGKPVMN
jgi:hypothetical protein